MSQPKSADQHIVDRLIEERAPKLLRRPVSRWLMQHLLYPCLGYHEAKAAIDRVQGLSGPAIMALAADEIAMRVRTLGASRLRREGGS